MKDLPRWEYILIIVCAEIVVAVIVTLVILWRCRWLKQNKKQDDVVPLEDNEMDELTDDDFDHKGAALVIGKAPLKHDYGQISDRDDYDNSANKKENLASPGPVIVANETLHIMDKRSRSVVSVHHQENMNITDEPETDVSRNESDTDGDDRSTISVNPATAVYLSSSPFQTSKHQYSPSPREISRLTPVEFEMKETPIVKPISREASPVTRIEVQSVTTPLTAAALIHGDDGIEQPVASRQHQTPNDNINTRHASPRVVRTPTTTASSQGPTSLTGYGGGLQLNDEALFRQFQREMMLTRSPPPSYQSSLG